MELPVWTQLRVTRRLAHLGDGTVRLPRAVSLTEAGIFGGVLVLMGAIFYALHIPTTPWTVAALILIPLGAVRWGNRPVADDKFLHHWLLSQIRYLLAKVALVRLERSGDSRALRSIARAGTAARGQIASVRSMPVLPEHPMAALGQFRIRLPQRAPKPAPLPSYWSDVPIDSPGKVARNFLGGLAIMIAVCMAVSIALVAMGKAA